MYTQCVIYTIYTNMNPERIQTLDDIKRLQLAGKTNLTPRLENLVRKHKISQYEIDNHELEKDEEDDDYEDEDDEDEKVIQPAKKTLSVTEKKEPIKNRIKKRVNIYISVEAIKKIQSVAYRDRTSVSAMIEEYIQSL